jgi:hypothetical protein
LDDSLQVWLKIIDTSENDEAYILFFLRLPNSSINQDARNKAIPVLEIIPLTSDLVSHLGVGTHPHR